MFSKGRILKMMYTHFFIHDLIARVPKAFIVSLRDKNGFNDAKSLKKSFKSLTNVWPTFN